MSKYGKLGLAALTAVMLAGSAIHARAAEPGPAAPPTELRSVSVARDLDGRPVVTLSGSGPMAYTTLELENPQRLVIDLKGTVSRLDSNQVSVDQGGVLRIRAGQFRRSPEPVSRVVVDLDGPVPYRIEAEGGDLRIAFRPVPSAAPAEAASSAALEPIKEAVAGTGLPETVVVEAKPLEPPAPRAVSPETIEKLLRSPAFATEEQPSGLTAAPTVQGNFETKAIVTDKANYSGKKISLNLVDTDVKQIFRLFHEISGLNFVLDPAVEGKVTIVLDTVPWDQALDIILKNNGLDKQLENNVIRIAPTQKLAAEAAQRKQLRKTLPKMSRPPIVGVFFLSKRAARSPVRSSS